MHASASYVPACHAELMKQTTSKSTVYFIPLYPPNMHYPARWLWDVHMPIYLHLSSARFLLHTMIMMTQTMSTITIAPTTIAIIMMRCSLSSFPHQLISTARQNNNLLPAILWEYIRNTLLICWKGKWHMQVHSHFNYITLYELQVVSKCIKNILQNLMLSKMEYKVCPKNIRLYFFPW